MSIYSFLVALHRAWEHGTAAQFLDANEGKALRDALALAAPEDAGTVPPKRCSGTRHYFAENATCCECENHLAFDGTAEKWHDFAPEDAGREGAQADALSDEAVAIRDRAITDVLDAATRQPRA